MADIAKQTWEAMKKLYPEQWLEIVDYEADKFGEVTRGVIIAHGMSIRDFPPPPANRGPIAIEHTGECRYRIR